MNSDLFMRIYSMNEKEACLHVRFNGKSYRIPNLLDVLHLVGNLKQLSMAIANGAEQTCAYALEVSSDLRHLLRCRFTNQVVYLEFLVWEKVRFYLHLSAREFEDAVAGMIARLPKFI